MGHLPNLIVDLALILMTGVIVALIFKKIRQPLVLGYIIAGFIVGPYFTYVPSITDTQNIDTLAELGVIFLLFSLGLEFSFRKLIRVGGTASITALVEIVTVAGGGFFVGKLLGWSTMDSMFLGGMLASSSTTIIIRAFEELGVKTKQFARIVFGVLIVEDIVVILLMVLLSTVAVSQQIEGTAIVTTTLKLGLFLATWFVVGIFLLPTLFKLLKKFLDDETLLLLSLALCLTMVVGAVSVGFSAELGAFVMGSIIAETTLLEKVEHYFKPVKDLFGAIFFISVGMMIDPQTIYTYRWEVLIVTLLTLFGKLFATTFGALLSGQPLKQSIQVGMSMAQIGEFAFIVASLGLSLGVISDFLFPVAVGASAITTFTTPYLIKLSDPLYGKISKILPDKWITRLNRYSAGAQNIQAESTWKLVLRDYGKVLLANSFLVIGIMVFSLKVLRPMLDEGIDSPIWRGIVGLIISFALAAPFLWAFMTKRPDSQAYRELWMNEDYNHGPLLAIETARVVLGIMILGFWVDQFFSTIIAIVVAVPAMILVMLIFSKRIQKFYRRLEGRFMSNLTAREKKQKETSMAAHIVSMDGIFPDLSPWDAHLVDLRVSPNPVYAGKTLFELSWREKYGVNVVYIQRGANLIPAPGRNEIVLPHDTIGVLATDEQLHYFLPEFNATEELKISPTTITDIALQKIVVDEHTNLKGHTIRSSGIREQTNGLVVGIQRGKRHLLNPESTLEFEWNDIIWIVGNWKKIRAYRAPAVEKNNPSGNTSSST